MGPPSTLLRVFGTMRLSGDIFWKKSINFLRGFRLSRMGVLGVGKTFRLLMQSGRFFSPDLSMKISQKLSTIMKFCCHSTPKGAPAYAIASESYDWNVSSQN